MVTSISSFNWPLFTWRLFTVPKNIYIYMYLFWLIFLCDLISSSSTWGVFYASCFFGLVFSRFCGFLFLFLSLFLPIELWSADFLCVCVIQLNFTTLQGSLLCFSSQIVLCSNASWKTLKMLLVWCLHQVNVNVLKVVHGWFWVSKLKRSCSVCC